MNNIPKRLFFMMTELTQLNNNKQIIRKFTNAINQLHPDFKIQFRKKVSSKVTSHVDVFAGSYHFGVFIVKGEYKSISKGFQELFESSVKMLAAILEKLQHDEIPDNENIISKKQSEAEAKFSLLFEQAADGIFWADMNGNFVEMNRIACENLGYSKQELKKLNITDIDDVYNDIKEMKKYWTQIVPEQPLCIETMHKRKDGSTFPVEVRVSLAIFEKEQGILGVVRDISGRKNNEEQLKQNKIFIDKIVNTAPNLIYIFDLEKQATVYTNLGLTSILGFTSEELIAMGSELFPKLMHPDDMPRIKSHQHKLMTTDETVTLTIEYRFKNKKGEYRTLRSYDRPFTKDEKGKTTQIIGIAIDITEQDRINKRLEESEERYHELTQYIPQTIFELDAQGNIIYVNDYGKALFDFSEEQLKSGIQIAQFIHPADMDRALKNLKGILEGTADTGNEYRIIKKDGTERKVLIYNNPIFKNHHHVGWRGVLIDITERYEYQQALEQSKKEWEDIFQAIGHPTFILKKNYEIIQANEATLDLLDFSLNELVGKKCYDLFHIMGAPPDGCPMNQLLKGNRTGPVEMVMEAVGKIFWVSCTPVRNEKGEIEKIIHIATEITERVDAEKALQESESRYRTLVDSSPSGIAIHQEGKIVFLNDAGMKMLGATNKEQIIGKSIENFVHPDCWDAAKARIKRLMAGEKGLYPIEDTYLRLDGSEFPVESMAVPILHNGKPAIHIIVNDITERKQAETSLRESEMLYRQLFEAESDAIFMIENEMGQILAANNAASMLYGYNNKELLTKTNVELSAEPDKTRQATLSVPTKKDSVLRIGLRYHKKKDGTVFPVEVMARFFVWKEKAVHIAAVRDITDRAKAEEALKHERDLLERITETSPIGITMVNAAGEITFANSRAESILEITKEEVGNITYNAQGWRITDFDGNPFPEEQLPFNLVKGTGNPVFDVRHAIGFPDGRRRLLSVNAMPLLDAANQFEGIVSAIEDITEQVAIDEDRRQHQEKYEQLFNNMLDGYALHEIICDKQGRPIDYRFLDVNHAFELMTGLKREKVMGKTVLEVLPNTESYWIKTYGKVALTGEPVQFTNYAQEIEKYFEVTAFSTEKGQFATIFIDVTERMLAEKTLEQFKAAMEYSSNAIGMSTPEGKHWYQNKAFDEMFGDLADRSPKSVYVDPAVYQGVFETIQKGGEWDGEVKMYDRNNEAIDVFLRAYSIKDENENIIGLVGVHMDISERKRMENELRESEANLIQAQQVAKAGHYIYNVTEDHWENSEELDKLFGVDAAFERNMASWFNIIHPDHVEMMKAYFKGNVLGQGHPFDKEYKIIDQKTGKVKWVHGLGKLRFDASGNLVSMMGTIQDVTERKEAEEELNQLQSLLTAVVEQSPIPMAIAGANRHLITMNPACKTLLGVEKDSSIQPGMPLAKLNPTWRSFTKENEEIPLSESPLSRSLRGETTDNLLWRVVRIDGTERWGVIYATPIYDTAGKLIAGLVVYPDITERMKMELEKEKLIQELGTKNAELERFTYTISHDLKSPMITIHGFLDILIQDVRKKKLDDVEQHYERISNAISKMDQLLKELLELSRIGHMMNPAKQLPFSEVAQNAVDLTQGVLEKRGISIYVEPNMPVVLGDLIRLREVMTNLIENAAKFMGKQKHPEIRIGSEFKNGEQVFYVRDNGVGIESVYQDKIFGLFDKLDLNSEGSGVGLSLVKRIIEVHHGEIWVESEGLGKGATFYFSLPIENSLS